MVLLAMMMTPMVYAESQAFNVEIDIPPSYQKVVEGTDMWVTIKMLNLANSERMDVSLKSDIVDKNDNVIVTKSKTVAVETTASFVVDLKLPEQLDPGDYYVVATVNSTLGQSVSRTPFTVIKKSSNILIYYIIGSILLVMIMLFVLIKSKPAIKDMQMRLKIKNLVRQKLKK